MTQPMKALKNTSIKLGSLPDLEIVIRKISPRQIGMDASLALVQQNALVREAAFRAEQGSLDAQQVSTTPEYPGTSPRHEYENPDDPLLKMDLLRASETLVAKAGLVTPLYSELCEMYDADPEKPWLEMGPDFDTLIEEIATWSGIRSAPLAGKVMTPPEAETFPEKPRPAARRDGRKVGKDTSGTSERKSS